MSGDLFSVQNDNCMYVMRDFNDVVSLLEDKNMIDRMKKAGVNLKAETDAYNKEYFATNPTVILNKIREQLNNLRQESGNAATLQYGAVGTIFKHLNTTQVQEFDYVNQLMKDNNTALEAIVKNIEQLAALTYKYMDDFSKLVKLIRS